MDLKELAQMFSRKAQANRIQRVVVILGLPRSGTTLAAAVLDSHPQCTGCFEPWNAGVVSASRPRLSIEALFQAPRVGIGKREALEALFSRDRRMFIGNTLVIKETSVHQQGIKWTGELLSALPGHIEKHLLWSVRCLSNTYLSHIHRSRSWWGRDVSISVESYEQWTSRSLTSIGEILRVLGQHNGMAYSYAALCNDPQGFLERLMPHLGLAFEAQQLEYFNADNGKIRGDRNVKFNPQQVSSSFELKRQQEWEACRELLSQSRLDPARREIDSHITGLDFLGIDLDRNWVGSLKEGVLGQDGP